MGIVQARSWIVTRHWSPPSLPSATRCSALQTSPKIFHQTEIRRTSSTVLRKLRRRRRGSPVVGEERERRKVSEIDHATTANRIARVLVSRDRSEMEYDLSKWRVGVEIRR